MPERRTKVIIELPDVKYVIERWNAIAEALKRGDESFKDPTSGERFSLRKLRRMGVSKMFVLPDNTTEKIEN